MRKNRGGWMRRAMRWIGALATVLSGVVVTDAGALTINVKTPDGAPITTGFRYTIEEDRTLEVVPGCTGIAPLPPNCPRTHLPPNKARPETQLPISSDSLSLGLFLRSPPSTPRQ